jgi:hypothetical protein
MSRKFRDALLKRGCLSLQKCTSELSQAIAFKNECNESRKPRYKELVGICGSTVDAKDATNPESDKNTSINILDQRRSNRRKSSA